MVRLVISNIRETKNELLRNGYKLFREKGYNATGIQEITQAVNVSKGSFYNHFKHKEIFANEVLKEFSATLEAEYAEALNNSEAEPLTVLRKFYQKKIDAVINKEKFKKGCVVSNLCQEVADKYEDLAITIDNTFEVMAEPIKKCLDEAQLAGNLSQDKDTTLLAEMILNSWNGALMRVKASKSSKAFTAFMYSLDILLA